jgi:hypothetical protein
MEESDGVSSTQTAAGSDTSVTEVIIVNYSELCAAGFDLREVIPLQLEAAARS